MNLRDFIKPLMVLKEGGNLEIDGVQAQQIDLLVHNRAYITPILSTLLNSINAGFQQNVGGPLWSANVLKSRKYLSGSSLHFFNTDIPDEEFERVKPKVGDIDTQINKEAEPQLAQWLDSVKGQVVGNARFLGYSRGNEQYSSLWELTDPPIKVQIDFEFVDYENDQPTDWAAFSHSSSWEDMTQINGAIKGVFHKWLVQSLSKISSEQFVLRKVHKRTGKITDKVETDSMISFAVSSKEGGGLRTKYEPVLDEKGRPLEIDGLPVLRELPPSNYEKDISKIFQVIFGERIDRAALKKALPKTWSFTGLLELINLILPQEEKESVLDSFVNKLFARGAQGLYKGDAERDVKEKNTALNYALKTLNVTPPVNIEQMRQDYVKNYRVTTTEGPIGLDRPIDEDNSDTEKPAPVKAQLRKGMPHLHDLKPADLLDLLDEIHDGNGNFKLENIPLNVKVDGFGGRFGKNSDGKPFMGTSNTEPRYAPGFVAYHQKKGTTDPDVLGRAQLFDNLFEEMMKAVQMVDSKLGPKFLINKQVTCEVLYLPFATETPEGKLKFVGIHYDKLPEGVNLALVPFRVTDATTGDDLPNANEIVKELTSVGKSGSVMFIDNSLTQSEGLDVTALVPPLENIEQMKSMLASRKRDQAAEVKAALASVATALEQAIIKDPNIIGKDLLGQDYEGIVINSRLGPIKVTSQEQRDVITAKNAAKVNARTERPRENSNKTAVVAVGSFAGHIGHQELFKLTIDKATSLGGDPYLFMGNRVGENDPIPINDKLKTWKMLYPQYANNISAMTQPGGSLIQKMKHELINPLPGKPPRYDNVIIMTGEEDNPKENKEKENWPSVLMKAVNKFQGYEHVKSSIEFTTRGTGVSFTQLRNDLKTKTPEQAFAAWSNAFNAGKSGAQPLPPDWIKHLMDVSRTGMKIQQAPTPVPQPQQEPLAEQRLFNALLKPLNEGTSIDSTLRAIINDIGEPITSVYDTMKFQAKKYMENHGELGRGFRMVAAGVGGRWVQNMYIGRLHNELHDLCKYNTRRTGELRDFLRGEETDGELEMKRSFGNLANNLPPILAKLGEQINAPQLTRNARRWMQNKAEYERYLMDIEAESDDEPDDEPVIKPPKSNVVGQQNAQVDQIVNDILSKVPRNIAGEIRNAIARAPNKLAALKQELDRHHVKMAEDTNAMSHMAKDLTGHGSPIAKAAAQRDKKREQQSTQSHGRAEVPKWDMPEDYDRSMLSNGFSTEQEINGILYKAVGKSFKGIYGGTLTITAYDKNKKIGIAQFTDHFEKSGLESLNTDVDPAYQRQGIASTMYAYARMLGNTIHPSIVQTKQGEKMWKGWKKSGDAKFLKKESVEENNHWYDAGVKDAQRDAKLYPDRVVKKLNPRTYLPTLKDKQAKHPEEVEQYSQGYRSVKPGVAEGSQEINWVKPNFDFEWHEVEEQSRMKQVPVDVRQYYQKHFPNKDAWLKAVQHGKAVVVPPDHAYEIRNAPFDKASLQKVLAPTGHEGPIGPAKEKRVNDLFDKGQVEMPIILKTSQGLWLIGGKTRLGTANYVKGLPAKVWLISGEQGVAEGSSYNIDQDDHDEFTPDEIVRIKNSHFPDTLRDNLRAAKKEARRAKHFSSSSDGGDSKLGSPVGSASDNTYEGVAEARMSAAQRLWNAEQKQRAKSNASLARTPSSIPKPEPKKDEKTLPVSEDVENIMDSLINKIIFNEAISNNKR